MYRFILVMSLLLGTVYGMNAAESETESGQLVLPHPPEGQVYRMFGLSGVSYESVEGLLRPILSGEGSIQYDVARDAVVLCDKPELLTKAEKAFREHIQSAPNIRVTFSNQETRQKVNQNLGRDGGSTTSSRRPSINGRPGGVGIGPMGRTGGVGRTGGLDAGVSRATVTNTASSSIVVRSGLCAKLWSGSSTVALVSLEPLLQSVQWEYIQNRAVIVKQPNIEPVWVNTGVSLLVRPEVLGNGLVRVEIFPEISYPVKNGKRDTVRVQSLTTTVTLSPGETLDLGEVTSQKKEKYMNLFGPTFFNQKTFKDVTSMKLGVEVIPVKAVKKK